MQKKIYALSQPDRSPNARFGAVKVSYHSTFESASKHFGEGRWYPQKNPRVWLANFDGKIVEFDLID